MDIRGVEVSANALPEPLEGCVEVSSKVSAQVVYEALANVRDHLQWAGKGKVRMLSMDAAPGLAKSGSEFASTGTDPNGTFADRSVVTEATPGRAFEFVTESELMPKRGGRPVEWTLVHRYEISAAPGGGSTVSYRYRVTRISRLIGPLRMLASPFAFVLRKVWKTMSRRGLRNLVAFAEQRTA